jgi:hypothetical protein
MHNLIASVHHIIVRAVSLVPAATGVLPALPV